MGDHPQSALVARVLDQLDGVHRNGSGWTARCSAQDDRANSLSVGEGDDGRAFPASASTTCGTPTRRG